MTPPLQDAQSGITNSPIKTPEKTGDKMGFLSRKNTALLIGVVVLAVTFCRYGTPAAAQTRPTATPLPQVILTQQSADAAAANVTGLQAERAEIERRLSEINTNIENQIAEAERATAAAKVAAATQNAVEFGAAVGRLEGAVEQLRNSYAGKDSIIADMQTRNEQLAAQNSTAQHTIDKLTSDLQQANASKKSALDSYNALRVTKQADSDNEMASNAVLILGVLAFLMVIVLSAVFVIQRRPAASIVQDTQVPIEGDYTVSDNDQAPL